MRFSIVFVNVGVGSASSFEALLSTKSWRGSSMLRMIEHFFEVVEANVGCAVLSMMTSFVMTGCLQLILE